MSSVSSLRGLRLRFSPYYMTLSERCWLTAVGMSQDRDRSQTARRMPLVISSSYRLLLVMTC